MENIQRDLEKEIAALHVSRLVRKNTDWTLLLVGSHGRVVTLQWFRWMLAAGAFVLLSAVLLIGVLFYLYLHSRHVNAGLKQNLDGIYEQMATTRKDKEVLMTRLMLVEAERDRLRGRTMPKVAEKGTEFRPETGEGKLATPPAVTNRLDGAVSMEGRVQAVNEVVYREPAVSEKKPKVLIEDLKVFYETADRAYRAQFVIRNNDPSANQVSGYVAVILKKDDTPPNEWVSLPALPLDAGMPSGTRKGQYFSIYRFKDIQITVQSKTEPQLLDMAVVYVFDQNKNVLLEKDFSIQIQVSVTDPHS